MLDADISANKALGSHGAIFIQQLTSKGKVSVLVPIPNFFAIHFIIEITLCCLFCRLTATQDL